ncbi:MAG: tRNA (N(6)-L-threonylcarbamoyladenosine(37)-C(2))-methylthiotransferase [Natrialbaceae archaeon]|nr:tRNA (N(6)-L-threonylcarbamoyladenosine(37)-C(2))-methylthiotransferase [Natrialbaceae archaeon]
MAQYHLETYGCTANRGESLEIQRRLRDAGHARVDDPARADVAVLNTCTVVETTEDNMLRRADELADSTADLVVTGCMALAQAEAFESVDASVCHWEEVPSAVGNGECPTATVDSEPILDGVIGILPIARGCLSDCSYCITKQATGRIDSPSVEENVQKARALIHAGAKELRATGQDTGVYGWDRDDRALPRLLDRICAIEGDFRVRLGMANPKGVHGILEELVETFQTNDELYNFLHIPVQSGSDDVLAAMRRQHQVAEFETVVEAFDDGLSEWTLSTDFIVGFPNETRADHDQSMGLLRRVRPAKVNITRFSKRPGTDAANMHGLGGTVKKERSRAMTDLKHDIVSSVYESMVGESREDVLVVEPGTGDSVKCRDRAYRNLIIQNASEFGLEPGDIIDCRVTAAETVYAFAEPV